MFVFLGDLLHRFSSVFVRCSLVLSWHHPRTSWLTLLVCLGTCSDRYSGFLSPEVSFTPRNSFPSLFGNLPVLDPPSFCLVLLLTSITTSSLVPRLQTHGLQVRFSGFVSFPRVFRSCDSGLCFASLFFIGSSCFHLLTLTVFIILGSGFTVFTRYSILVLHHFGVRVLVSHVSFGSSFLWYD